MLKFAFKDISYLGRIGGDNVRDCGRRILNALMTTDVAITLNWKGVKKSFEALSVCSIVKAAVRKNNTTKNETDDRIEGVIKKLAETAAGRQEHMNIMSHSICLLCRAVKPTTFQALANTTLGNTTRNKIFQSYSQQSSILSCSSLIQSRCMSSKFKKDDRNVHRKDAACIGEGDRMYEPQSPYREPWPKHYGWENKLFGGGALPKLDKPMKFKPVKKQKDGWDREHALFGQNDYIDILGDGNVRPVDLMRGPSWLRGFRGNEMQRIVRQLKYQEATIRQLYPTKFKDMEKRLDYLFKHYNVRRSNRMGKGIKTVQK